eukprot:7383171-Prymnesium_polylepis.1
MHTFDCRASRPVLGCPQAVGHCSRWNFDLGVGGSSGRPLVRCARGAAEPHRFLRGAAETPESLTLPTFRALVRFLAPASARLRAHTSRRAAQRSLVERAVQRAPPVPLL